jgi:hypothetical protein
MPTQIKNRLFGNLNNLESLTLKLDRGFSVNSPDPVFSTLDFSPIKYVVRPDNIVYSIGVLDDGSVVLADATHNVILKNYSSVKISETDYTINNSILCDNNKIVFIAENYSINKLKMFTIDVNNTCNMIDIDGIAVQIESSAINGKNNYIYIGVITPATNNSAIIIYNYIDDSFTTKPYDGNILDVILDYDNYLLVITYTGLKVYNIGDDSLLNNPPLKTITNDYSNIDYGRGFIGYNNEILVVPSRSDKDIHGINPKTGDISVLYTPSSSNFNSSIIDIICDFNDKIYVRLDNKKLVTYFDSDLVVLDENCESIFLSPSGNVYSNLVNLNTLYIPNNMDNLLLNFRMYSRQ